MTTATMEKVVSEREILVHTIESLIRQMPDIALLQIKGYIERVQEEHMEELEDEEDIAYIDALPRSEYENAVPEKEIIADYEAKYGTLD
jgi:hypothetical protein